MAKGDIKYAGFPSALVYKNAVEGKEKGDEPVQHLIWGDWIHLKGGKKGDWLEVHARNENGWMHKDSMLDNRLLEFTFVDVAQGDGCLITTPDDNQIVVDAGQEDNMYRFLRWKFGRFVKKTTFQSAIITHPDQDHYYGFRDLIDDKNVWFENMFHNGIFSRKATKDSEKLGKIVQAGKIKYLTDIVKDRADLGSLSGSDQYTKMMQSALNSGRVTNICWLSSKDGYLPGYESGKKLSIQVLGPVPEPDAQNKPRLRWFGDSGKTKNGHSIILIFKYGNVSVFIGGDLNSESEDFLLNYYTGATESPKPEEENDYIESSRKILQSDVYKSCHHGSSDFSSLLLKAINPIATVISSGDDEPYSHPRSDTLGALGKYSRGSRPLIFSTELARSSKENIKHPNKLKEDLRDLQKKIDEAANEKEKEKLREKFEKLVNTIDRSVAVYGAINVRTDGNDIIIAQKIEQPTRKDKEWDIYVLKRQSGGWLQYESKYQ